MCARVWPQTSDIALEKSAQCGPGARAMWARGAPKMINYEARWTLLRAIHIHTLCSLGQIAKLNFFPADFTINFEDFLVRMP